MKLMASNDVWDLIKLPEGNKIIVCKWIFKTQRDSNGNVRDIKFILLSKALLKRMTLIIKRLSLVYSKDFLRIMMASVAHFYLELHHTDVKTVFLNGNIDETIYMVQPNKLVS